MIIKLNLGILFVIFAMFAGFISPVASSMNKAQQNLKNYSSNYCSTSLTPKVLPGSFWEQHRNFLMSSIAYVGADDFIIKDENSNLAFSGGFNGNHDGRARFSVLTRLTWLFPEWEKTSWVLLYKCSSTPQLSNLPPVTQ